MSAPYSRSSSTEPSARQLTNISHLAPADSVLSVQNVSKKFCRSLKRSYVYGLRDIFCEVVGKGRNSEQLRDREFWSVRNVSLEVKRGQSIGLVGVNGSGKSTLLRMISGLMKPDTGRIVVRGRIAALIALGAGFNPLLTGRENVFINMAILGLKREDIQHRFKDVVDFAEVWEAIDAPVRTYSSGMRARLGFACAIFTDPDILLLDEVLAVGDAMFRAKCYRRLALMREQGTSFFLVSHNSNAVLNLCNTAVFLQRGEVIMRGTAEEVIGRYEQALGEYKTKKVQAQKEVAAEQETAKPREQTALTIERVNFVDADNQPTDSLASGQPATLCIQCTVREPIENAVVNIVIREPNAGSDCILNMNSDRDGQVIPLQPGRQEIRLNFPHCGLRPHPYLMKITLSRRPFYVFDMVGPHQFEVKPAQNMNQCKFYQPRQWQPPSTQSSSTQSASTQSSSTQSSSTQSSSAQTSSAQASSAQSASTQIPSDQAQTQPTEHARQDPTETEPQTQPDSTPRETSIS
ncbi:MAG: ABC transporter ATP-binding protein [Phormidesmis sp.]